MIGVLGFYFGVCVRVCLAAGCYNCLVWVLLQIEIKTSLVKAGEAAVFVRVGNGGCHVGCGG